MQNRSRWWLAAAIILAWLPVVVPAAYSAVWQWSTTASSNASADPAINWREGQPPSSVNDSARAMMAALASYRDDISGLLATGGTSTAYTVTTNQGLCVSPSVTPQNGQQLSLTMSATNGASPTLQADTCNAYPIQSAAGVAVGAATLISGSPYTFRFSTVNNAWMLRDFYSSPFNVALGGFLYSTIATPPNSNFIIPDGQCISNTTYSTYWTALGSPASGGCPGGQFAVVDVRSRNLTPLDNLGGSAANRLTSSATGCGTAFTSLGVSCGNAGESTTLATGNLPPYTPSGAVATTFPSTIFGDAPFAFAEGGCCIGFGGSSTGATPLAIGGVTISSSFNGNAQGGTDTPFSRISPNIGVYIYLRVL